MDSMPSMNSIRFASCCFSILLALAGSIGCGNGGMSGATLKSAQEVFDQAIALESSKKYSEILPLLNKVLQDGGLNPDQLSEAYLLRARCHCEAGATTEAEKDLELAEQGAPDPASYHLTRAILLSKLNKVAESKAEMAKAIKINPKLKQSK